MLMQTLLQPAVGMPAADVPHPSEVLHMFAAQVTGAMANGVKGVDTEANQNAIAEMLGSVSPADAQRLAEGQVPHGAMRDMMRKAEREELEQNRKKALENSRKPRM